MRESAEKTVVIHGKDGQEFQIKRAVYSDVEEIMEVMEKVKADTKPEWFVSDEREYVEEHIEKSGFILVAKTKDDKTAGFFMIDFPGQDSRNLGFHLELKGEELNHVAHMDSAAVLADFRGNHLQEELMRRGEELLNEMGGYRYRMCTVCPENRYSLYNLQKRGYMILMTTEKYGGLQRHIMYKDIEKIVEQEVQIGLQSQSQM